MPRPRHLAVLGAIIILVVAVILGLNMPGWPAYTPPLSTSDVSQSHPMVCIYYYPWYSREGRHWGSPGDLVWGVVDKPVIGYYDSTDQEVVEWQLYLIRKAGIDCLFISWWGPGSFEDKAARLVFEAAKKHGLMAAILVEPYLGGNPNVHGEAWWRTVTDYIKANFIDRYPDVYMKLGGKPLILAFNPIGEAYKPNTPEYTVRIVGNGLGGRHDWKDWDLWPDYDTQLAGVLRVRVDGYVAAAPRIDRTPLGDEESPAFDPGLAQGWYERQWNWILEHIGEVRLIAIYSWNEYHERSAIEPHWDASPGVDPYRLYDLTAKFIGLVKRKFNP